MSDTEDNHRRVRSFVRREGRMTLAQKEAFEKSWAHYGLVSTKEIMDFSVIFQNTNPCTLEIGFGMGDSLFEQAKQNPEQNFIGIEVHRPGLGRLFQQLELAQLDNVRVFCDDAIDVLNLSIADNSLDTVNLFFPDPWPKRNHHKRRIVQPSFAELINTKLKFGGHFHMATDWEDYAKHMLAVLTEANGFVNIAGAGQYAPRPDFRPLTKFEKRGQRLGHGVWDLLFVKSED